MAAWLSKVFSAISNLADANASVREALQQACDERIKVSLEMKAPGQPSLMTTTIEQVREADLAISQPIIGGHTYPLAFGEPVRLSFIRGGVHHGGRSRCLGRIKIASGVGASAATRRTSDQGTMFAYRLEMPQTLETDDQRGQRSVQIDIAGAIEAQLYAPQQASGPCLGTLIDISMSTARVRSSAPPSWIAPGQPVFIKAMLPEPVGLIDELVDVSQLEPDGDGSHYAITISFRRRINGLAELMRTAA
jgi:hypothetical protein